MAIATTCFHLKNLATGEEVKTPIGKVADLTWAADNKTIFFVTEDTAKRDHRLWRYTLGDKEPTLLYEEKDELFTVNVDRSRDGKIVFLGIGSSRTTEFRFLPADKPDRRMADARAAPERNRVLPGTSRRRVLPPHERWREGVPRRDRRRWRSRAWSNGRS
jgi:protease II